MQGNFRKALTAVLVHEGGFVNDPQDPGGATNKGVTQAVYDNYRKWNKLPVQSVKHISIGEMENIYKREYWDRVKGDSLPSGVDYCVFDFAVNSGVSRASKYLQRAVGVTADGNIGPATISAATRRPSVEVIEEICERRQAFLESLATFKRFGKGWTRRVVGVEAMARGMA